MAERDHTPDNFFFFYIETKISSPKEMLTGVEIKQLLGAAGFSLNAGEVLVLEGHGQNPDQIVSDSMTISVFVGHGQPVKHFFPKPATNFGYIHCFRQ
jgi:hypothetical protein